MILKQFLLWIKNKSSKVRIDFKNNNLNDLKEGYVEANNDVYLAIEQKVTTAEKHFNDHGYNEVKNGQRLLAIGLPFYNEQNYLECNSDIKKAVAQNVFESGYQHYLQYGAQEMLTGTRKVCGKFPQADEKHLLALLRPFFNYEKYKKTDSKLENWSNKKLWQYFIENDFSAVVNGEKELYLKSGLFNELDYVNAFPDILQALINGDIQSPIEHFLMFGAKELSDGERRNPDQDHNSYQYNIPEFTTEIKQNITKFSFLPVISIVMPVYNVEPKWLLLAYQSLVNQWYTNWELCICDDKSTHQPTLDALAEIAAKDNRIKISYSTKNENISQASNHALAIAKGEFVALMDHDDELTVDALYQVIKVLQNQSIDFVYSDEDKIELSGEYVEPHFKPDFSPDMFLAHNYMSHLGVIRREIINQVGGWRVGFEGAQDYDLYLRVLEQTNNIHHIDKILYHWRKIPGSTAASFSEKSYAQDAGLNALKDAVIRRGIKASVINGKTAGTYRVNYHILDNPLVSIIIPFKDQPALLIQCLDSILAFNSYQHIEIICIDNQSTDKEIPVLAEKYQKIDKRIKFVSFDEPFNYSRINNVAVDKYATGEYILFMNNDIQLIEAAFIEGLLEHAQRDAVGAVGAQLFYANDTIQHAGLVMAPNTGHGVINVHKDFDRNSYGYFSRLQSVCNYSAVTAALLMVSREKFKQVGGFNEVELAIAYNDVDLCLNLHETGLYNIYTPFVKAYHHESASRGYDDSFEKINKQRKEQYNFKLLHSDMFLGTKSGADPYFNVNFSLYSEKFTPAIACTENYKTILPQPFTEERLIESLSDKKLGSKVCVFSHFDNDGQIKKYVIHYLKVLSEHFDIIFVSTAEKMKIEELNKIAPYVHQSIVKKNVGYDFGAWKTGIEIIKKSTENLELLLLCNDSVFGPLSDLSVVINKMKAERKNVFSISDSFEIKYHLQSYFVLYDSMALNSSTFIDFWNEFSIYENKQELIVQNEIGFSQLLLESELEIGALVPATELGYLNNSHIHWKKSLIQYHSPFIKVELLRDNPFNIDLSDVEHLLTNKFNYPMSFIQERVDFSAKN
jgi:glycosyltransferase involved in cell wall biosynthesis